MQLWLRKSSEKVNRGNNIFLMWYWIAFNFKYACLKLEVNFFGQRSKLRAWKMKICTSSEKKCGCRAVLTYFPDVYYFGAGKLSRAEFNLHSSPWPFSETIRFSGASGNLCCMKQHTVTLKINSSQLSKKNVCEIYEGKFHWE